MEREDQAKLNEKSHNRSAFENFKRLTSEVMATPKSTIDAREVKYRAARKNKNRKRHR